MTRKKKSNPPAAPKKSARKSFLGDGTEPVLRSLLRGSSGSTEFDARTDGVSEKGQLTAVRDREGSTEPLPFSYTQWATLFVRSRLFWGLVTDLERDIRHSRTGRHLECCLGDVILVELMTWLTGSYRETIRQLRDDTVWAVVASSCAHAWPNLPGWRLSPTPISRSQFYRFREQHLNNPGTVNRYGELCDEYACKVGEMIGIFDINKGSFNKPDPHNLVAADATFVRSWLRGGRVPIVDEWGEIIGYRRHDPDAQAQRHTDGLTGQYLVILSGRNQHCNERVIVGMDFKEPGESDATVAVRRVLELKDRLPGLQGLVYDMAARGVHVEALLAHRLHLIAKVPRLSGGNCPAHAELGNHNAASPDGTINRVFLYAVDGAVCMLVDADGEEALLPLERKLLKDRLNKGSGTYTIYGTWKIPDHPCVPMHLRGASTTVRLTSTDDELASGQFRSNWLRGIAECDPLFKITFGRREDAESINNHLKGILQNERLRCVGRNRQLLHLRSYQLKTAFTALIAYHRRTGTPLAGIYGASLPEYPNYLEAA